MGVSEPWIVLELLDSYLNKLFGFPLKVAALAGSLDIDETAKIDPDACLEGQVHIGARTRVEKGVLIRGPAWIGDDCEVRQGAYLRGMVLAGDGAILGHCSEFKRCILLEGAQAPHFNYVGDSVLGIKAHIGAGVILSNVRLDKKTIRVALLDGIGRKDTGMEKLGAIIGDACEIGCNSVLNPGTMLGSGCRISPLSQVKGSYREDSIIA
jgi:NDP-sugar pyrophosphorylase family protein